MSLSILILSLLSSIILIQAHAETGFSSSKPTIEKATLPRCIKDPIEIQKIKDGIAANKLTEYKYKGYQEVFRSEDDVVLMARLSYAETLAARCPEQNEKMLPLITNVITKRVNIRKGDVRSVVFQRDQFASSMNIYDNSKYLDFLCPKDQKLWDLSYHSVVAASGSHLKNKDTVHYFLYKHDAKWTKEPAGWRFIEDTSYTNPELQACIRFFKNPKWK